MPDEPSSCSHKPSQCRTPWRQGSPYIDDTVAGTSSFSFQIGPPYEPMLLNISIKTSPMAWPCRCSEQAEMPDLCYARGIFWGTKTRAQQSEGTGYRLLSFHSRS